MEKIIAIDKTEDKERFLAALLTALLDAAYGDIPYDEYHARPAGRRLVRGYEPCFEEDAGPCFEVGIPERVNSAGYWEDVRDPIAETLALIDKVLDYLSA